LIFRWTCLSIPRRPHKTPAHTVKDLSAPKRSFRLASTRQHFVPVSRLSYITFRFRQHPSSSFFSNRPSTQPPKSVPLVLGDFRHRLHFGITSVKGRESYNPFSFRQPSALNFLNTENQPTQPVANSPGTSQLQPRFNFRLSEGARIVHRFFVSSSGKFDSISIPLPNLD
jgi:hypothetical protein